MKFKKILIRMTAVLGALLLASCSSWQEDESDYRPSSSQRTSSGGPVAFRTYSSNRNADGRPYQDRRAQDYRYSDSRQLDYWDSTPRNSRYQEGGYYEDNRYQESPQSTIPRDPLERQWNTLRREPANYSSRWNRSSSEFPESEPYWSSQDNLEILRNRTRTYDAEVAKNSSLRGSGKSGFTIDYERLAPGSSMAKEIREEKERELRLAEERKKQREQVEREGSPDVAKVGRDLPRRERYDREGRIESLREIARQELKPDLSRSMQEAEAGKIPMASVYNRTTRLNLAQILGRKDPISLRSTYAKTSIPIKISPRMKVDEWTLKLVYTHSTSIVPRQSQVIVSLDQVVVAQIEMVPDQPYNAVEIPLPKDLSKGKEHEFQIAVNQPYSGEIQGGSSGRFTQIDLEQSYLEVKGHLEPVPAKLSEFRRLFDYNMIGEQYPVHFCIPGSSNMLKDYLEWGAVVAQGVGLRIDGAPLKISHGERLRANQDNVLIGDVASLAPFLEGDLARSVTGPFIAIQPLYRDDRHFLIVLGGRNAEEVHKAVEAFAISPDTLPDTSFFSVTELQLNMEAGTIPVGRSTVRIPGDYSFGELGAHSRTMDELAGGEYTIDLFLPGNYLPSRERDAAVEVHFTYSSAETDKSYLQMFVGNLFVGDISLVQASEGSYRKRSIALPPQSLRPGHNQIRLVYRESSSNVVGQFYPRSNPLTILDSSRVSIPVASGTRELPDLSLMASSGFPLTDLHSLGDLTVYITDGDSRTVDSAWTFLSKLSRVSGSYLHGVTLTFNPPENPKNMLIIGLWEQLSDKWHEGAPLFSGRGSLEYRASRRNTFAGEAQSKTLFEQLQQKVEGKADDPLSAPGVQSIRIGIGRDIPENVIVAQYENPVRRGYLITMMAAASPGSLYEGTLALQEPMIWNSMHGEMMLLSTDESNPTFSPSLDRFAYRGEREMTQAMLPVIWEDTWIQVMIILGALLLLAIGTAIWIRKTSPSSYKNGEEEDDL